MHYGLLPRANRGIFAINELPDLAGKIQVGLFNIMQEGDVQIKGYPVRLPLDVALVFSANPEDYTARGKIITPLKDRIGSEIRTHYPGDRRGRHRHHRAGSLDRAATGIQLEIPDYIREVIEQIAFVAREDKRIDKRSRREPAAADHRAGERHLQRGAACVRCTARRWSCRASAISTPRCPSITGKLELEYEGEMKGADNVAREIIRAAVARTYDRYFHGNGNMNQVVQWFDLGGEIQLRDSAGAHEMLQKLRGIQGLLEKLSAWHLSGKESSEVLVSAAEFILEGLYAHKRIGRSEERNFHRGREAAETRKAELAGRGEERDFRRQRRPSTSNELLTVSY